MARQLTIKRPGYRSHLVRRAMIIVSFISILVGLQSYIHFSNMLPLLNDAREQFVFLADERRNLKLTAKIVDSVTDLRSISEDETWQRSLDEIQSEFQGFSDAPAEGLDVTINNVVEMRNRDRAGAFALAQLESDLRKLDAWHRDYYGDAIAAILRPAAGYWPTSVLLKWHYGNTILDAVQFNRGLYLITVGEVSAGQAILGELRTRLPDSSLRARVMFTQGRLLYGMGRFESSIEVVQASVQMDPDLSLAKRFLEYQLSKGPDEEVEEEDESLQRVGSVSSGGATLF